MHVQARYKVCAKYSSMISIGTLKISVSQGILGWFCVSFSDASLWSSSVKQCGKIKSSLFHGEI